MQQCLARSVFGKIDAQTIAEHVEDSQVLDHFRRCKIDFGHGFELAKVEPL